MLSWLFILFHVQDDQDAFAWQPFQFREANLRSNLIPADGFAALGAEEPEAGRAPSAVANSNQVRKLQRGLFLWLD